jgi:hypothetical protein
LDEVTNFRDIVSAEEEAEDAEDAEEDEEEDEEDEENKKDQEEGDKDMGLEEDGNSSDTDSI